MRAKSIDRLGYRYITQKENLDLNKVLRYTFQKGDSCGRFVSVMVKNMLELEKSSKNDIKAYVVENPGILTFSSSKEYLLKKYKAKYAAGSQTKGPFYKKFVCGLFKLMIRTMMKYKGKHKSCFKKVCVLVHPKPELDGVREINLKTKSTRLTRKVSLNQLVKLL